MRVGIVGTFIAVKQSVVFYTINDLSIGGE